MGWYGLLAIEGMALGKAVVCHLRPDFVQPGCPVVDATAAPTATGATATGSVAGRVARTQAPIDRGAGSAVTADA